jgi:uncharacterized XkdX family phage protein
MNQIFEKIKRYYDAGLWNEIIVKNAVKNGAITAAEYKIITGEKYTK